MDSHFLHRFGRIHLAAMDTANWISTGTFFLSPLFCTSLDRLDLLGLFDSWAFGSFHTEPGTLEYLRVPLGPCVAAWVCLPRSASTATVGVSVVAIHGDLVVLR